METLKPWLLAFTAGLFLAAPAFAAEEVCPVDEEQTRKEQADDVETCMREMRPLYYKCNATQRAITDPSGNIIGYVSAEVDPDCVDLDLEVVANDYKTAYRKLLDLDRRRVIMDEVLPETIDRPIKKN